MEGAVIAISAKKMQSRKNDNKKKNEKQLQLIVE